MRSPFEGETITLRPVEAGDVPALQSILNHPDLAGRRQVPWRFPETAPLSCQQVEAIVQSWSAAEKALHLAVEPRESTELLGYAECDWGWDPHCPSASLVIAPPHQRRGYGSEAIRLLLRYLFDYTPAHNVGCWIAEWNAPALRFASYHRFQVNGRMRRAGIRRGTYYDLIVADILRPEWRALGAEDDAA